jgi:hypothetical protein
MQNQSIARTHFNRIHSAAVTSVAQNNEGGSEDDDIEVEGK